MHNHCDIACCIIYKADYIMYMINIPIYKNVYQSLAGFVHLTRHDPNVKQQFSTKFLKSPLICLYDYHFNITWLYNIQYI